MKRITALALVFLLLAGLCACGQRPEQRRQEYAPELTGLVYGRHVEEELFPPGLEEMHVVVDVRVAGQAVDVLAYRNTPFTEFLISTYHWYHSEDGGDSWEEYDVGWMAPYCLPPADFWEGMVSPVGGISLAGFTPEGDLLVLAHWYGDGQPGYALLLGDRDGNAQEIEGLPLRQPEEGEYLGGWTTLLYPLEGGLALFRGTIATEKEQELKEEYCGVIDLATGEEVVSLAHWWGGGYLAKGQALVLDNQNGTTVLDVTTGEETVLELPAPEAFLRGRQLQLNSQYEPALTWFGQDGMLYAAGRGGVQRLGSGMEEAETVMESRGTLMGMVTAVPEIVRPYGDNGYIAVLCEGEQRTRRLMRYVYDEEALAGSDEVLRVWSLEYSYTIAYAAAVFERQWPGIRVEYHFEHEEEAHQIPGMETVRDDEDIVRELVLQLLAGTGPDVLVLDGLPVESYIRQGALADLTGAIEGLELIEPVANVYREGEKLQAIPAGYALPVGFTAPGGEAVFESPDALADALANDGNKLLYIAEPKALVELFLSLCAPAFVQGDGVDEAALAHYLELLGIAAEGYQYRGWWELSQYYSTNAMGRMLPVENSMQEYMLGNVTHGYDRMEGLTVLEQRCQRDLDERPGATAIVPIGGMAAGPFTPQLVLGVNENSTRQEMGCAFVRTVLRREVQDHRFDEGLPVNRASLEMQLERLEEGTLAHMERHVIELAPGALWEELDAPLCAPPEILESVRWYSLRFLEGELTQDEAAEAIVVSTQIYFEEKR